MKLRTRLHKTTIYPLNSDSTLETVPVLLREENKSYVQNEVFMEATAIISKTQSVDIVPLFDAEDQTDFKSLCQNEYKQLIIIHYLSVCYLNIIKDVFFLKPPIFIGVFVFMLQQITAKKM